MARPPTWSELAKDCIAFANAVGGRILLGIEDTLDKLIVAGQVAATGEKRGRRYGFAS